ncbi:3-hydroxybutyryl-CoA dehydrogenase [Micromonospora qiuiae]|uniref:3-hydroxybutyryl-CoA dehydrogenase n=1 Tax=Micromonospora qiuiae TaxID=502268 RepID=A0ABQ4JG96_9ACTN|nr:3-hydroxybutyryl-CoA dehydrogenase [Micromonospora qiuiae]GIJ29515.1 3-hydroxybutyryl-CoA dehydrogenase [Micromonospora qiuiae]
MRSVERVGVIGSGLMGTGIAEACARAGLDVRVVTTTTGSTRTARQRLTDLVDRQVRKGQLTEDQRERVVDSVTYTCDLDGMADRDLVVEAIVERESAKVELFAKLDKSVTRDDAILATNTSSIPIVRLACATERPGRVVGVHFFNPVSAMPLVELVGSLLTDADVLDQTERFVTDTLGKQAIRCRDRAGFVVNALLIPYLLSAIRMLESGYATAQEIDRAMTLGCAHPMGPLSLADLIGLDTTAAIASALYDEFKEPLYSPPPLLLRMVEARLLGRKSGMGFHDYRRAGVPMPAAA